MRYYFHIFFLLLATSASAQFASAVPLLTGSYYYDQVEATDLDGDGDEDLVVHDTHAYSILLNVDGLGHFGAPDTLAVTGGGIFATADLDGDLDIDIVLLDLVQQRLVWVANDGMGGFALPQLLSDTPVSAFIYDLVCADITGSPLPEVLINESGLVRWFINEEGLFPASDSLQACAPNTSTGYDLLTGDVDLDGDVDLLMECDETWTIAFNEGDGTDWSFGTLPGTSRGYAYGYAWIDVDGDGDLDLVNAGWGVYWVENKTVDNGVWGGDVVHTVVDYAPNEGAGWAAYLGCGTGASIIWSHWGYTYPMYWSHYDVSLGAFTAPAVLPGVPPVSDDRLFFADLNGDDRTDLITIPHVIWQDQAPLRNVMWSANTITGAGASSLTLPPLDTLCAHAPWENSLQYPLPEGDPAGGLWSGTGVPNSQNLFNLNDPTQPLSGSFTLGYGVVDAAGCIASGTTTIEVIDGPTITPAEEPTACPGDRVQFIGSPMGGAWSAPADSMGMVNADCAHRPINTFVAYTFKDVTGQQCATVPVAQLTVQACAPVNFQVAGPFCEHDPARSILIEGPVNGGVNFIAGVDSFNIVSTNPPQKLGWFSPAQGPGTYAVVVSASGSTYCPHADTMFVVVNPSPAVTFDPGIQHITECGTPIQLVGGDPAGGVYTIDNSAETYTEFLPAQWGSGEHELAYTYTDPSGCDGTSTYLVTVDCATGITTNERSEMLAWPNPVSDQLTITFQGTTPANIVLMDAQGRTVMRLGGVVSPTHVDLTDLEPGTYQLRVGDHPARKIVVL